MPQALKPVSLIHIEFPFSVSIVYILAARAHGGGQPSRYPAAPKRNYAYILYEIGSTLIRRDAIAFHYG